MCCTCPAGAWTGKELPPVRRYSSGLRDALCCQTCLHNWFVHWTSPKVRGTVRPCRGKDALTPCMSPGTKAARLGPTCGCDHGSSKQAWTDTWSRGDSGRSICANVLCGDLEIHSHQYIGSRAWLASRSMTGQHGSEIALGWRYARLKIASHDETSFCRTSRLAFRCCGPGWGRLSFCPVMDLGRSGEHVRTLRKLFYKLAERNLKVLLTVRFAAARALT